MSQILLTLILLDIKIYYFNLNVSFEGCFLLSLSLIGESGREPLHRVADLAVEDGRPMLARVGGEVNHVDLLAEEHRPTPRLRMKQII
jgi:hypothetical protein